MDIRDYTRSYARSPLGIGSLFFALGAGIAARTLGLGAAASALLGLVLLAAVFVAGLVLGFGRRAAVAEVGRESAAKAASRLAEAAEARRRLASLRLSDPDVARGRDLVVLEAGKLVEDSGRAGSYDPGAVQAVLDALSLVDAWLKEADESSVEKRFGVADEHPFPEAAKRTAELLAAKAALVSAGRASATGEVPGADRIAIEEELK